VHYHNNGKVWDTQSDSWNDGMLETFAFGNEVQETSEKESILVKSSDDQQYGIQTVNVTLKRCWRLLDSIATSSMAPAGKMALTRVANMALPHYNMIHAELPTEETKPDGSVSQGARTTLKEEDMTFGDGASTANNPLITLLQRKVRCAVAVFSPAYNIDVDWGEQYGNVGTTNPKSGQVDWDLAALFGVLMSDEATKGCGNNGCNVGHNHVFETERFRELIQSFTESAKGGEYMLHTMDLKTVKNDFWGVEEGQEVRVTFTWLSTSEAFMSSVPDSMAACKGKSWEEKYKSAFPYGSTTGMTFSAMCPMWAALDYHNAGNHILTKEEALKEALESEVCRA